MSKQVNEQVSEEDIKVLELARRTVLDMRCTENDCMYINDNDMTCEECHKRTGETLSKLISRLCGNIKIVEVKHE